jgi:hypothetical protein
MVASNALRVKFLQGDLAIAPHAALVLLMLLVSTS